MVNAREWMDEREHFYGQRLNGASLVVEANYTADDVRLVLKAFGARYRYHLSHEVSAERAFSGYPNCLLVAMVGNAATAPEPNTFWPAFWDAARIDNHTWLQPHVGDFFLQALSRRRLPSFSVEAGSKRFVGPAAMHAAIPAASVPKLLDVVLERRLVDPGTTGEGLLNWLLSSESRSGRVGRATELFLRHGGELAADVLDRVIEVVAYAGEQPEGFDTSVLDTETTGLPVVILDAVRTGLADRMREIKTQPVRASRSRAAQETCSIGLDVSTGSVVVHLPSVRANGASAVTWAVTADGRTETVEASTDWVGSSAMTTKERSVLSRPARRVIVRLDGIDHAAFDLVDNADPLLLFDLDGAFQPPTGSLPRGDLWAVTPEERSIESSGGVPARVVSSLGSPVGWRNWSIRHIDPGAADGVRLGSAAGGATGPIRLIRQATGLVIRTPAPSRVLRTRRGAELVSGRPWVSVPEGHDVSRYHVDVVRTLNGVRTSMAYPLADCVAGGDRIDVLSPLDSPLLGEYSISVRGAFGQRSQRLVSIVEGVQADSVPDLRFPLPGGLEPASVTLSSTTAITPQVSVVDLAHAEISSLVTCVLQDVEVKLVVSPPSILLRLDTDEIGSWTPTSPTVHPEMLGSSTMLHVQLPSDDPSWRLEFQAASGEERQSGPPLARRGTDTRVFDLSRFVETAHRASSGTFSLTSDSRAFVAAVLRPRRIASGARPEIGGIRLMDYRQTDDVEAAVYSRSAPWAALTVLPVSADGFIDLSDERALGGGVRVLLAVVDPWVATSWPDWPKSDGLDCDLDGAVSVRPGDHAALSRILTGDAADMTEPLRDLDVAWWMLEHLPDLSLDQAVDRRVSVALTDAVHRDPARALTVLARFVKRHTSVPALLISSGLVERRFTGVSQDDLQPLWSLAPVVAALAAVPAVLEGLADGENGTVQELRRHAGDSAEEILESGRDPHREIGSFNSTSSLLDALPAWRLDEMWDAVQLLPQGMLHPDSRLAAARQLFDVRHEDQLRPVLAMIEKTLGRTRRELREAGPSNVADQLEARLDGTPLKPWGLLPAASFAWAASARLRARDSNRLPTMPSGRREAWTQLSRMAPDYVGMDLVLADALIESSLVPASRGS